MSLLLKDGLILAGDGQAPRTGSVLIEGNPISAIVEDAASLDLSPKTETIDASDTIVFPGLVNAHLHSTSDTADFMAALRLAALLHKIGDPDFT